MLARSGAYSWVHSDAIGHPSDIVGLTAFRAAVPAAPETQEIPPVEIQLVIVAVVAAVVVFGLVMFVKYIIQS